MPRTTGLLPLTPRVFLILWSLDSGPQHGYGLLSEIEELGRGQVSIGPASLYEAIHTLRRRGLIEAASPPEGTATDDPRRRYFRLTDSGREVLRAEAHRLAQLVEDLRAGGVVDAAGRR